MHILPGKICEFRLDLQCAYAVACPVSIGENQRNNPASGSQLYDPVLLPDAAKSCKQDCIEGKAVPFPLLAYCKLAIKKSIATEMFGRRRQNISS